jgi:hypothetical protein
MAPLRWVSAVLGYGLSRRKPFGVRVPRFPLTGGGQWCGAHELDRFPGRLERVADCPPDS